MNKYQEYLEKAKKKYRDFDIDDMLVFLKEEKEHLKKLKNALENCEGIIIRDELNNEELIEIFTSDDNWESILKLIINSCENDLLMIKSIIFDKLEKGELFDE